MTATDTIPTLDEAQTALDAAKAERDTLRAAIVAGESSAGPAELAEANANIEHAELRLELAAGAHARLRAEQQASRAVELADAVSDRAALEQVAAAEARVREAIVELWCVAGRSHERAATAIHELERLGVDPQNRAHRRGKNISAVDSREVHERYAQWPMHLLLGAISAALTEIGERNSDLARLAGKARVGGIRDPRTYGDELRRQIDRLNGEDA